jgi:repressor LexA
LILRKILIIISTKEILLEEILMNENESKAAQEFGKRLLTEIQKMNMKQVEFVDALNKKYHPYRKFNTSTMSKWISGEQIPEKTYQIMQMAEFLGVNSDWLMFGRGDKYGEDKKCKLIPILGEIAAGTPIMAQEDIIGYESVPVEDSATFCLKVQGHSMINARIYDGDIIFIKEQRGVENGQIAAVRIGEEVTLKRVYIEGNKVRLHSENPTIPDMIYSLKDLKGEDMCILGKAIDCKFKII